MRKREGGGSCRWYLFLRACEQNYYGARSIAPIQGPILVPSPVTGPVRDQGENLHGSYESTTLRPQLWSGCWSNRILVKGAPWVFCYESTQICEYDYWLLSKHDLYWEGKVEKGFRCSCQSLSCYLSFTSTNNTGAYQLVPSCKCLRLSLQIWRQVWC